MKSRSIPALFLLVGCTLSVPIHAQDVTVGDPVWLSTEPPPDEMPKSKTRFRPEYPEEMRKSDEIGYVVVTRYLDASGQGLSLDCEGSQIAFRRAVQEAFPDWKSSPGLRGGKPVNSRFWLSVIFNPEAASPKKPDAIPRLLSAGPAFSRTRPTPSPQPPVVAMKLSLDAAGAITAMTPAGEVNPKALPAVEQALQSWRFAPARKAGQPVASELTVSVICMPPPTEKASKYVPPKVLSRDPPVYPYAMRRYGIEGEVVIDFSVNTQGKVENPFVQASDNPAFEEPALKSVRGWKFQPATSDGKPVKSHMHVPIVFQLTGFGPRDSAFSIQEKGDQSKLPPEFQYDTPPKFRNVQLPVYPYAQRRDRIEGKASVMMEIDRMGHVAEVRVLSADQPEFGQALAAAASTFVFDPALKNGRPTLHLLRFQQEFNRTDLPDDVADDLAADERKHPERIVGASQLDAPLKPVSRRPPYQPVTDGLASVEGKAEVEFLVDKEGRVRLARIKSASEPAFGYAAIQAVSQWWFEPPMSHGKPVVTRASVPFVFGKKPEKKPAAADAPAPASSPAKPTSSASE